MATAHRRRPHRDILVDICLGHRHRDAALDSAHGRYGSAYERAAVVGRITLAGAIAGSWRVLRRLRGVRGRSARMKDEDDPSERNSPLTTTDTQPGAAAPYPRTGFAQVPAPALR